MFTGREYDAETGLYYYRARYYSPELGRFLQRDPLQIDEENPYTYVFNDPVNYIDPYGYEGIFAAAALSFDPLSRLVKPTLGDIGGPSIPLPGQNAPANPKLKAPLLTQPKAPSERVTEEKQGEKRKEEKDREKDKNTEKNKKPKPPEGLVEHPKRKGKWGIFDKFGKFKEKWRFDEGIHGEPGWRGKDHLHFNGEGQHYLPDAPYPG